jgi:hypothetical protein
MTFISQINETTQKRAYQYPGMVDFRHDYGIQFNKKQNKFIEVGKTRLRVPPPRLETIKGMGKDEGRTSERMLRQSERNIKRTQKPKAATPTLDNMITPKSPKLNVTPIGRGSGINGGVTKPKKITSPLRWLNTPFGRHQ